MPYSVDFETETTWKRGRRARALGMSSFFLLTANPALAHGMSGDWGQPAAAHGAVPVTGASGAWSNFHMQSVGAAGAAASAANASSFASAATFAATAGGQHNNGANFASSMRGAALHDAALSGASQAFLAGMARAASSFNSHAVLAPSQGLNLDLTSSVANIVLGTNLFAGTGYDTATVTVGGAKQSYQAGQKVTAAEYVAIKEMLAGGAQSVTINARGAAVGGSINLDQLGALKFSDITIPRNVAAVDNFAVDGAFRSTGSLVNYGKIFGISTDGSVTAGTMSAAGIVNKPGAVISTIVPTTFKSDLVPSGTVSGVGLGLEATGDIVNSGTISSAGALSLVAGGSIANASTARSVAAYGAPSISAVGDVSLSAGSGDFLNAGVIASSAANVNFSTGAAVNQAINLNNSGGTIKALSGDINIRDVAYKGSGDSNLLGGDFQSNNLNINSGSGAVTGYVGEVTGNLNTAAGAAHVVADTDTLNLGSNCINGDPLFVNAGGDIHVTGPVDVTGSGQPLTIVASGDVYTNFTDQFARLTNNGGDITVIAGANITSYGGGDSPTLPGAAATGSVTIDPSKSSTTGGNIDFSNFAGVGGVVIDSSSKSGPAGNITLAAYSNGTNRGNVKAYQFIDARSSTRAGDVTIVAGATSGKGIVIGSVFSTGNGVGQPGTVTLSNSQPRGNAAGLLTYNMDGTVAAGPVQSIVPSGKLENTSLIFDSASAGKIIVETGGNITMATSGVSAFQDVAGNGGSISFRGASLTWAAGTNLILLADAAFGSGNAGTVKLSLDTPITLGTAVGEISLSARVNGSVGNGGTIVVTTPGDLTINDPSALNIAAGSSKGNGGNITMTTGKIVSSGQLSLNSVAGPTSGDGGIVSLIQTGKNPITVDLSGPGAISMSSVGSAGGGNGGQVILRSAGPLFFGPTDGSALNVSGGAASGNGGSLTVSANGIDWTNSNTTAISFQASASKNGNGGAISVADTSGAVMFIADSYPLGRAFFFAANGADGGNAGAINVGGAGTVGLSGNGFQLFGPTGANAVDQGRLTITGNEIINIGFIATAGVIQLNGGAGGIGTSKSPLAISAGTLSAHSAADVNIQSVGSILVDTSSAAGAFNLSTRNLTSIGVSNIVIGYMASISANTVSLSTAVTSLGSGSITQADYTDVDFSTSVAPGIFAADISLVAASGGNIAVQTTNPTGINRVHVDTPGNISLQLVGVKTDSIVDGMQLSTSSSSISITADARLQIVDAPVAVANLSLSAGSALVLPSNIITARDAAGNGGSIYLRGSSIGQLFKTNVTLDASGAAGSSGAGGTIAIELSSATNVRIGTAKGAFQLNASGGDSGGAGGAVSVITSGTILIDTTVVGNLAEPTSLNYAPSATGTGGNGGSLELYGSQINWTNQSTNALHLSANGLVNGNGGRINISQDGASFRFGTGAYDIAVNANGGIKSGNGGNFLAFNSGKPTYITNAAGISVSPLSKTGNGGSISVLTFSNLFNISGAPVILNASAAVGGKGDGGSISLNTSSSAMKLGNYIDGFQLLAQGGSAGGNGGNVSVSASGGVLLIGSGAIAVNPLAANGDGGSILASGQSLSVDPTVVGVLDGSGRGTGNGGRVTISAISGSGILRIGTGLGSLNVNATGTTGGTVSIFASNTTLSIDTTVVKGNAVPVSLNVAPKGKNNNGGTLSLSAQAITYTNSATAPLLLSVNGTGTGNGGSVSLSGPSLLVGTAPGAISLSATGNNAGKVSITTTKTGINFATSVAGGVATPLGINISQTGANGNGGSITLSSAGGITWDTSLTTTLSFNVSGKGSGDGGVIKITSKSPVDFGITPGTIKLIANSGAAGGNGGSITVTANAGMTVASGALSFAPLGLNGDGGAVSLSGQLTALGSGPLVFDATGKGTGNGGTVTIAGTSPITLGNAAGNIQALASSGATGGNGGRVDLLCFGSTLTLDDDAAISVVHRGATGTDGRISLDALGFVQNTPGSIVADRLYLGGSDFNVRTTVRELATNLYGTSSITNVGSVAITSVSNSGANLTISTVADAGGNGAITITGYVVTDILTLNANSSGGGEGGIRQTYSPSSGVNANQIIATTTHTTSTGAIAAPGVALLLYNSAGATVSIHTDGDARIVSKSGGSLILDDSKSANLYVNAPDASISITGGLDVTGTAAFFGSGFTNTDASINAGSFVVRGQSADGGAATKDLSFSNSGVITAGSAILSGSAGGNFVGSQIGNIQLTVSGMSVVATAQDGFGGNILFNNGTVTSPSNSGSTPLNLTALPDKDGLSNNGITLTGSNSIIGDANFTATGRNQFVTLASSADVTTTGTLTISTPTFIDNGVINAGKLVFNGGATGGFTVANNGNMDLDMINGGSIVFSGSNLVFLAAGDITDNGNTVTIDTSDAAGFGGSVTFLAGFNFSPTASDNSFDPTGMYTIAANPTGNGSAYISKTTVTTGGLLGGGNVGIYAHVGDVQLPTINTSSTDGRSGNVTVIGQDISSPNIFSNITTAAPGNLTGSGNISLTAGQVNNVSPVYIQGGSVGGGVFESTAGSGNITIVNTVDAGKGNIILTANSGSIIGQASVLFRAGTLSISASGNAGTTGKSLVGQVSELKNISVGGDFDFNNTADRLDLTGIQKADNYALQNSSGTTGIMIGSGTTISGNTSVILFSSGGSGIDMVDATGAIDTQNLTLQTSNGGGNVGQNNAINWTTTAAAKLELDAGDLSNVRILTQSANATIVSKHLVGSLDLTNLNNGFITVGQLITASDNGGKTSGTVALKTTTGDIAFIGSGNVSAVHIDLQSQGGNISLSPTSTQLLALADFNGDGGSIKMSGASIFFNGTAGTTISADGTTGSGGIIDIRTTGTSIGIGLGAGEQALSATGKTTGGSILVAAGFNLDVDPNAITVAGGGKSSQRGTIELQGIITQTKAGALDANTVIFNAADVGKSGQPVIVQTNNLIVNADDAYIDSNGPVTLGTSLVNHGLFLTTHADGNGAGSITIGRGATLTADSVTFITDGDAGLATINQADDAQILTVFAKSISLTTPAGANSSEIRLSTSQGSAGNFNASVGDNSGIYITTDALRVGSGLISGQEVIVNGVVGKDLTIDMGMGTIQAAGGSNQLAFISTPSASGVGGNLYVTGINGTFKNSGAYTLFQATTSANGASSNVVEFSGTVAVIGNSVVNAKGVAQAVIFDSLANYYNNPSNLEINSPTVINNGNVVYGSLTLNSGVQFAGTYASSSSIDISSLNLSFIGKQLTILSGGDITSSTPTIVGLGNSTGDGGSLYLLAGFQFTPSAILGNNPDTGTTYEITATGSGSIDLSNSKIDVSSTVGGKAGNVFAYANGGISLGDIIASAGMTGASFGGNVDIIGTTVQTGFINTSAATAGNVTVTAAKIALDVNPSFKSIQVFNGAVTGGSFVPSTPTGGDILIGAVQATGTNPGSTVRLTALGGQVNTSGTINADNVFVAADNIGLSSFTTSASLLSLQSPGYVNVRSQGATVTLTGSNTAFDFILQSAGGTNFVLDAGASIKATNSLTISTAGGIDISAGKISSRAIYLSTDANGTGATGTVTFGDGYVTADRSANGDGGSVVIIAKNVNYTTGDRLTVDVSGSGTGNGGTAVLNLVDGIVVGSGPNEVNVIANSGASGGNGGSIYLNTVGALTIKTDSSGALTGPESGIHAQPLGASGAGGSIGLRAKTLQWTDGITPMGTPLLLDASGVGSGDGGSIYVDLPTVSVGSAPGQISFTANSGTAGGRGGSLQISGDNIVLNTSAINIAPLGVNGDGGEINLTVGKTLTNPLGGPIALNVDGVGAGNGGTIDFYWNPSTPLTIGTSPTDILTLSANAGASGGNGGDIAVKTIGDLTVNPTGFSAKATGVNGAGATLSFWSGFASGSGNLLVTGSLAANGSGTGVGGSIALYSDSKLPFTIGTAKATNGVQGTVSASGVSGIDGAIDVQNEGSGGITISQALTRFDGITLSASSGGSVSVTGNLGGASTSYVYIATNGNGSTTGKFTAKTIQAKTLNVYTGAQPLTLTTNVSNLLVQATGNVTVTNMQAANGLLSVQGLSGKAISLKSSNIISTSGAISGESVTLQSTGKTSGSILLGGSLTASTGAVVLTAISGVSSTSGAPISAGTTVTATAAGTGAIISIGGNITANTAKGAVTLTAAGTGGSIQFGAGSIVDTVGAVKLTAAKGTIVQSKLSSISSSTKNITATAANSLALLGILNAATGLTIKSTATAGGVGLGTVNSAGPLVVTSVGNIVTVGDITLTGAKTTIALTASGVNSLIEIGGDVNSLSTFTATAAKGGIQVDSTGDISTGTVAFSAGNSIYSVGAMKAATNVTLKTTIASSTILTNFINLGGQIGASNGAVLVVGNGGIVSTLPSASITASSNASKPTGTVTIEIANTKTGTIVIGAGTHILTSGTGGGNVNISIGAPAKGVFGKAPAPGAATYDDDGVVTTTAKLGGPFFFGANGITINSSAAADVTLKSVNPSNIANKGQVIFNTGKLAATAITVNGTTIDPTVITADPPALEAASRAFNLSVTPEHQSLATSLSASTAPTFSSLTSANATISSPIVADTLSLVSGRIADSYVDRAALAATTTARLPMDMAWISDTEIANGTIPAIIHSDSDFAITSDVSTMVDMRDDSEKAAKHLHRGSVVFAPTRDTQVHTDHGTISIAARSLVLVIAYADGLAVYDLDDSRQAAVKVASGEHQIVLAPGRCAVLTARGVERFAEVNPAQMIVYRGLRHHVLQGGKHAFTGEFAGMSAVAAVTPLKKLMTSDHPEARRISNRLMKTMAILNEMRGSAGEFQQHLRPQLAAYLK